MAQSWAATWHHLLAHYFVAKGMERMGFEPMTSGPGKRLGRARLASPPSHWYLTTYGTDNI
jgi:hypothetical protein